MTVALRPRSRSRLRDRTEPDRSDLAEVGVHRDPDAHDPIATGGFAQRLVHKASAALSGGRSSRRSFLTRTAVVGSAVAAGPIDFIMKPGTAYGYVCGTCSDGWTAFCCTINAGRNSCPPGSFVAGWWKADNAAYCCGAARYIIDCNATCPTQCRCRCAGGACDGRKTCCNQFRYGQCNQQIACYGPVVCRVATCTVPWRYDPACTTASATDNRTVEHGAPCLTKDCGTAIDKKYQALGGASGFLGPPVDSEVSLGDGRGRRRRYRHGNIYWTAAIGAREVHGGILDEFDVHGGVGGVLGYPTSDTRTSKDGRTRYANFENGRVYYFRNDGHRVTILNPFFFKHETLQGVRGYLGYPTSFTRTSSDRRSRYVNFEKGRIYAFDGRVVEIHGQVFDHHESTGGVKGPLRYPVSDLTEVGDGRGKAQWFERGFIWYTAATGAHGLWGQVLDRFVENGQVRGYLKYPTSRVLNVGDGRGTYAEFQMGNIYASPTTGGHQVHGAVLTYYLAQGGPTGALGYPTSELDPSGTAGGRFQSFERGRVVYRDGVVSPA